LDISLVVSTYQAGKLVMVRPEGNCLNTRFRGFNKPMGLAVSGDRLAIGTALESALTTRGRRHYVRGARHPVSEDFFHHQPFYLTFPERRFP
jgi:hypothetical protein